MVNDPMQRALERVLEDGGPDPLAEDGPTQVEIMDAHETKVADMRQAAEEAMERALEAWPPHLELRLTFKEDGTIVTLPSSVSTEGAYQARAMVAHITYALGVWSKALEAVIAADMAANGAEEKVVDGTVYSYKAKPGDWVVDGPKMRTILKELLDAGLIVQADYDKTVGEKYIPASTEYTYSNASLNKLEARGDVVRAKIAEGRKRAPSFPKLEIKN